MPIQWQQE